MTEEKRKKVVVMPGSEARKIWDDAWEIYFPQALKIDRQRAAAENAYREYREAQYRESTLK